MPENHSKQAAESIFARISPRLCIVSTPNVEFNALFSNKGSQFRNRDHKFEWTRSQFKVKPIAGRLLYDASLVTQFISPPLVSTTPMILLACIFLLKQSASLFNSQ